MLEKLLDVKSHYDVVKWETERRKAQVKSNRTVVHESLDAGSLGQKYTHMLGGRQILKLPQLS